MKKIMTLFTILFMFVVVLGCSDDNPTNDYTNNTVSETLDYGQFYELQINAFSEQLYYTDDVYYIYYYQENCGGCIRIKDDVLSKIDSLQVDTILLFDVYFNLAFGGIDLEPSFNLSVTPSLVKVYQNQFVEVYEGPDEILSILETIE